MPSTPIRREFEAYLASQLGTAETLGLDQLGLPISSDAIESLFGVAKRHGVGPTHDAARIAMRLPALCGAPTREEAEQVVDLGLARQHEITTTFTSLTQQRRQVLGRGEDLESLGQSPGQPYVELLPSPKSRSNHVETTYLSMDYEDSYGPHLPSSQPLCMIENRGLPDMREAVAT